MLKSMFIGSEREWGRENKRELGIERERKREGRKDRRYSTRIIGSYKVTGIEEERYYTKQFL